jgi:hypothetical protein
MTSIRDYVLTRSNTTGMPDEYQRIFASLGIDAIAAFTMSTVPIESLHCIQLLLQGTIPAWSDIDSTAIIEPSADYNMLGTYIHVGRRGDATPFQRGAYIGSAGGEAPESNFGKANLIGILKRVWCQHGSMQHREATLQAGRRKGRAGNRHYPLMYEQDDTPELHVYLALNKLTPTQLRLWLGQSIDIKEEANLEKNERVLQRNDRLALLRVAETCWMIVLGLYRWASPVLEGYKCLGFELPEHRIKQCNLTHGLEQSCPSWEVLSDLGRIGGNASAVVFAQRLGLGEGTKASLNRYMEHYLGADGAKKVSTCQNLKLKAISGDSLEELASVMQSGRGIYQLGCAVRASR